MVPKICSIPECERPSSARGWCQVHYARWQRHGNPMALLLDDPGRAQSRFWPRVEKTSGCWNWIASLTDQGYGFFHIGKKVYYAHRLSYEWVVGDIPAGLHIDHMCHNRACVNPDHLRVVTPKQNLENLSGGRSNSKAKIRGVSWHSPSQKWRARVMHNGQTYYLGRFDDAGQAGEAARLKRLELFTHNIIDRKHA